MDDWGLRDRPLASSLAMTLAAGASWLAVRGTGNPVAGAMVAVLLAIILWRTWLPVRYTLGSGGVMQSVLGLKQRIPWLAIQRFDVRESGVLLLAKPYRRADLARAVRAALLAPPPPLQEERS